MDHTIAPSGQGQESDMLRTEESCRSHPDSVVGQEGLQRIWAANSSLPSPLKALVHDLIFENIIPTNQAICAHDGNMNYQILDHASSTLAQEIAVLGVGPGDVVPLCFEKSMWMPVAMLGVMKAGAASMALDMTQPEARLRSMVEQVRPSIILSSKCGDVLARSLYPPATVIQVGERASLLEVEVGARSLVNHIQQAVPSDPLYMVFTSGSTGTPKGVVISHTNFSSALKYQTQSLGFCRTGRVLDFASHAFDATWYNTLHTFYAGGCLCIPSEDDRKNDLNGSINRLGPTFANLTPKVAELLDDSSLRQLHMVELAGEAPNATQVERMRQQTAVRFAYGPAECSVLSTVTDTHAISPTIGQGVGVCTWVVDADDPDLLVPIGSIGELWLEGPLVGQGYYNDPERTRTCFVEDPEWLSRGAPGYPGRKGRLYRTGDLVRQEGETLVFAGRKDGQVKIRGQRVELADVEHHILENLPGATRTKVVAEVVKLRGSDDGTLIAFIQDVSQVEGCIAQLEARLAKSLPTYMVPSIYIALESLGLVEIPLTPTGKTDRKCLRELSSALTADQVAQMNIARGSWQSPQTPTELLLQTLWSQVLAVDRKRIGTNETFFNLGGDSIKAMRLVATARRESISITVQDVFKYNTIETLGRQIDDRGTIPVHSNDGSVIEPYSLLQGDHLEARRIAAEACKVSAHDVEDIFPCTPLQSGIMALSVRGTASYIIRQTFDLLPSTDLDAFRSAWERVHSAEPILRSRIVDISPHGLVQVVMKERLEWSTKELEAAQGQTLGLGTPLCHFAVDESRKRFTWTIHHAICDGWSMPLILNKLEQAYYSKELPPSRPFQAFLQHIASMREARASTFWRTAFEGMEAEPFPKPLTSNYEPNHAARRVVEDELSSIAWPKCDATPSTIIRAAWSILAVQHTACDDVLFGVTVSGRHAPVDGIETITGPTIATIPCRIIINPKERVEKLLSRIQCQSTEAIPYEQSGLQNIRSISADAARACDFQTLLVVQPNGPQGSNETCLFSGGRKSLEFSLDDFNPYAVMLECQIKDDGVKIRMHFDSEILEPTQAARIVQQLRHILMQITLVSNHSTMVEDLQSASPSDVRDILKWNINAPNDTNACVHDMFSKTVENNRDRLAIFAWDGSLTYSELDELSSQLAFHLAVVGVGPDVIVPVSFEKSMWVPVSMLAVLKAGGAFTMLPPSLPEARLEMMLQKVAPIVVLAAAEHTHKFPNVLTICPKEALRENGQPKNHGLHRQIASSARAAVLFTSGSTGQPKAISLDHGSLSSAATHLGEDCGVNQASRIFQFASYSFDVSIHDTFTALTNGACLCIPSEQDRANNLAVAVTNLQANWVCLAPSVAELLSADQVPTLQTLVFAGENLTDRHVGKWVDRLSIFNWYGPAEASVCSTMPVKIFQWQRGMIGSGSAARCWIVSKDNVNILAPIGAIGELVAEGPIVMQEYLDDEERTTSALMKTPTWLPVRLDEDSEPSSGRIYKTGDLVRYASDGTIIYVGRKDAQVKLRGQRIELGDIEHHVSEAILRTKLAFSRVTAEVITPKASESPMLAVFLQSACTNGDASDVYHPVLLHELNDQLATRLPSHMIPSAYIAIKDTPSTSSGKVDRRSLRAIGESLTIEELRVIDTSLSSQPLMPPDTPEEKQMQRLWGSILKRDISTIRAVDSFFDLGGDSITAMRLVNAAREQNISITVAEVFRAPRLCDMALLGRPTKPETQESIRPFSLLPSDMIVDIASALRLPARAISDAFPVTHFQAACIDDAQERPLRHKDQFYVDMPAGYSHEDADGLCQRLWHQVEGLRRVFVHCRGQHFQVVLSTSKTPPNITLHLSNSQTVETLSESIFEQPDRGKSDAPAADLCTFHVFSGSDGRCRLGIQLSHALYDGTTLLWLLKCLIAVHQGHSLPTLPPYSAFMRHVKENEGPARRHWRRLLRTSTLTELVTAENQGDAGLIAIRKEVPIQVSPSGYTAATIFTSACAQILACMSNSDDVTFGRVVSGRAMLPIHLRNTFGPCLTVVPVRVRTGDAREILQDVHEQHIDGMPYETLGYGDIATHCTDWPKDATGFGCVAHFRDLGDAEELCDGATWTLKSYKRRVRDVPEGAVLQIMATPLGNGCLSVELLANARFHTEKTLVYWVEQLDRTIQHFSTV